MRDTAQDELEESINFFNEGISIYDTYVPPSSASPQTAYDMLTERLDLVKSAVNNLADIIIAEHPTE